MILTIRGGVEQGRMGQSGRLPGEGGGVARRPFLGMRFLTLIACLGLCGCSSRIAREEITDSTESNQLVRIDREIGSIDDALQNRRSFEFDSLVWRTNAGGAWHDRVIISKALFQVGAPRRRWVTRLHSFDPTNGTAIIMVAEESPPRPFAGGVRIEVVYSWREWSLLNNREIRLIRDNTGPFGKY
jgi:hypothetical protein